MNRFTPHILATALFLFCCISISYGQDWKQLENDHSIVYFLQDETFAHQVSDKAELYYKQIADDLGYARNSNFWTWDNRVKIYIYPDRDSYSKAANMPAWSEGMADYTHRQIICYAWHEGFLDGLLPHEMTHLIFRDFVGFKGQVPVWLDEGVAQWEEPLKREQVKAISKYLLNNGTLLCVEDMVNLDIRRVQSNSIVHIHSILDKDQKRQFLSLNSDDLVRTYYIEAVSLVEFLIKQYGADNFTEFCRKLRDGKSFDEALGFAYPQNITSVDDLEKEWLKYVVSAE
jgi:hypothetical protein